MFSCEFCEISKKAFSTEHLQTKIADTNRKSLLNRVGCVVTWVTWVSGLWGSVGTWVAWVKIYVGCVSYVGQNIFYVGHNFYVGCVGQIYFCVGPEFFAWVFAWVTIFCVGLKKS